MRVKSFDKIRLKILLHKVFDYAYAVYNCINFAAGTFNRVAQYLMPKRGLICPDPNHPNDRRRFEPESALYNAGSITTISTGCCLFVGALPLIWRTGIYYSGDCNTNIPIQRPSACLAKRAPETILIVDGSQTKCNDGSVGDVWQWQRALRHPRHPGPRRNCQRSGLALSSRRPSSR